MELKPRTIEIRPGEYSFPVRPVPFRVWEAAGEAPRFVILNRTDFDASVVFPPDLVAETREAVLVPAHGKSPVLCVNTALAAGSYPYTVTLSLGKGPGIEGIGGSRPDIEIQK